MMIGPEDGYGGKKKQLYQNIDIPNIFVGPGLQNVLDAAKYAQDMKEMLSKDVEELASSEEGKPLSTVDVRGRKMVIPRSGQRRPVAVLFACLSALESPAVDAILKSLGAEAQFVGKNGSMSLEPLVQEVAKASPEPAAPRGRRNLIVDEEPAAHETFLVAVLDASGNPEAIGVQVGADQGEVRVKLASREVTAPAGRVILLASDAHLLDVAAKIRAARK